MSDPQRLCQCSTSQIQRYTARISGPLLDHIDLHTEVPPVPYAALEARAPAEASAAIRARVNAARARQRRRFAGTPTPHNAAMSLRQFRRFGRFDVAGERLLEQAVRHYGLSARAQDRLRKVARTIADLAGDASITALHVSEAIQYRARDWRRL